MNSQTTALDLLRRTLREIGSAHPDSYLNSELYYFVTGRKGMEVQSRGRSCVVSCQHPNVANTVLFFPEIGRDRDGTLLVSLLQKALAQDAHVRLAKFTTEDFQVLHEAMTATGCHEFIKVTKVTEEVMDWKYPSQILSTDAVSSLSGSHYSQLRHKVARYRTGLASTSIREKHSLEAWTQVVHLWTEQMRTRGKFDCIDISYYDALLQLAADERTELGGLVFRLGDLPVGLSVWHIGVDGVANQLVSLCDTDRMYLSQAKVIWTTRHLRSLGINFLNLGGSETESLDRFKRQFLPASSIQSQSADLKLVVQ